MAVDIALKIYVKLSITISLHHLLNHINIVCCNSNYQYHIFSNDSLSLAGLIVGKSIVCKAMHTDPNIVERWYLRSRLSIISANIALFLSIAQLSIIFLTT